METINGSVIPAFYKMSEYKTNDIVDDNVRHIVRRAKMEIYNALDEMFEKENNESNKYGGVLNRSHKKDALIVGDLEIILGSMPDWVVEKPREASPFIFALSTGLRAHACSFVTL
ncbi:uncharacterized protein MONOS_9944 [Monocercomonoides exilis]|uniref:uncharacterized protein n=1 Tax=Monocercomonoides exilis TaxID=2049356 RepID=UPI00355A4A07|nr:hypothetical protein MONOS_9944 [Monocercomonoides exilis]|eukprot:MONOS_9944.1-p1 / transcript=MONOS_9944.1 / gene=MONOS_9944 / organism=Monocercomonoides_exilis_PA203 / gene_product=unspecified product / transcript_product=unspecified product / location=Mono_scaffold00429:49880-50224(+) / protein_length=115 / sequence_SO=supercontig / SO=protein_coding / is_pseudo=false